MFLNPSTLQLRKNIYVLQRITSCTKSNNWTQNFTDLRCKVIIQWLNTFRCVYTRMSLMATIQTMKPLTVHFRASAIKTSLPGSGVFYLNLAAAFWDGDGVALAYFFSFLHWESISNWEVEILTRKQKGENSATAITLSQSWSCQDLKVVLKNSIWLQSTYVYPRSQTVNFSGRNEGETERMWREGSLLFEPRALQSFRCLKWWLVIGLYNWMLAFFYSGHNINISLTHGQKQEITVYICCWLTCSLENGKHLVKSVESNSQSFDYECQ